MAALELDRLDRFVIEHARRPWAWGLVDCSLAMADWLVANGYPDPAPHWRGAYRSESDWRRVVAERGGLLPIVAAVAAGAGLRHARAPVRGTIGVVGSAVRPDRQWGCIFDGRRWLNRSPACFVAVTARPLGAWEV